MAEQLSGFNEFVDYVHNKSSLIDPLGEQLVVIAGSANFSEASTKANDENVLVIKGDKLVADIYFVEFWRLFKHHSFREGLVSNWTPDWNPKPMLLDEWWKRYFGQFRCSQA